MLTKTDLQAIGELISINISPLGKKIDAIDKRLRKVERSQDESIRFFDRELVRHDKRLKRAEEELNLEPLPWQV